MLINFIWSLAIILLIGGGIYLCLIFKFKNFKFKFKSLFSDKCNNSISSFESLMITLGSKIGVGSLAGIGISICYGGIGSIFWIWISSLITSVNSFSETILGIIYKKDENNGPWNYIELVNKKLSYFYIVLIICSYLFGFIMIQGNTISNSLTFYLNFDTFIVSIVLVFITYLVIRLGVKSISIVLKRLVPLMLFIYVFISLLVIIINFSSIVSIFSNIIYSAFNPKSFLVGFLVGIRRGVFASESGIGSSVIASSAVRDADPIKSAFIQELGVLFTTFVICTGTAFIILSANIDLSIVNINGIEMVQESLMFHLGSIGYYILIFLIISFAFSTIAGGYFYGEMAFKYLFGIKSDNRLYVLKIVMLVLLLCSCYIKASFLWMIIDLFVALMAIINMYSVIRLSSNLKEFVKRKIN